MKTMKTLTAILTFILMVTIGAVAQSGYTKMTGKCTDESGQPIADAVIQMRGVENGAKYDIKTDKKGVYFSVGVLGGVYNVALVKNGSELFHQNGIQVKLSEDVNKLDFDLAKEKKAAAANSGLSSAELKAREAAVEGAKKNNSMMDFVVKAQDAATAGDMEGALNFYKQAAELKPDENYIYGKMGDLYLTTAKKATDAEDRAQKFQSAVDSFKKAIELAQASTKEKDKSNIGPFYNNMGEALAKTGKLAEAVDAYTKAAGTAAKPTDAGMYYFNLGAIMVNNGHMDEAAAAFDKSITADPTRADAFYWKGVALAGKAPVDKDGKVAPLPGTVEAFNKYLELKPDGPLAAGAKEMLAYLGSSIQTKVNTKKK